MNALRRFRRLVLRPRTSPCSLMKRSFLKLPWFATLAALVPVVVWYSAFSLDLLGQGAGGKSDGDQAKLLVRAEKLLSEGNGAEAMKLLQPLLDSPPQESGATDQQVRKGLELAFLAQQGLGTAGTGLDALLEGVQKAHPQNWRVLTLSASILERSAHQGSVTDGKYQRQNWTGKRADSTDRDRVQGLVWLRKASTLALQDAGAPAAERVNVLLTEANGLLSGKAPWELQSLTDLEKLPEVEINEGGRGQMMWPGRGRGPWGYAGDDTGYPVDAAGNPVYFKIPASWDAATSDGERWRYLLKLAAETDPASAHLATFAFASEIQSWLDVDTLQRTAVWPLIVKRSEQDGKEESDLRQGIVDLPTLKPEETITKLATGIRRHTLPEDYRFIPILRELGMGSTASAPQALIQLAFIHENRQQRELAAAVWKEVIERHGKDPLVKEVAEGRLSQIEGHLGKLEGKDTLPAGQKATVDLVFRNAKQVKLTARPVKLDALLDTLQAEYKARANGKKEREQSQWTWLNQAFGSLLSGNVPVRQSEVEKYLGEPAATWEVALEPREKHADRRITLETPLSRAGVYFLEATFEGGGVAHCMVELADLVVLTKPVLNGAGAHGFVLDATTGRPVSKAKVLAFGYRHEYRSEGNRSKEYWFTREQRITSGAEGIFPLNMDEENRYNWLLRVESPDGGLAVIGFNQFYRHYMGQNPDGQQLKLYITTDRPAYRPGQKVYLAGWARRATYEEGKNGNEFANQRFVVRINDPRGEKLLEQHVVADANGAMSLDLSLADTAGLGRYSVSFSNHTQIAGHAFFQVEEYKKPEFEVKVKTPEKPVQLGEPFTATVEAKYYFGGAVSEAKVHYKVERVRHDASWFPVTPWDWLYGPGYWWRNNDYAWLPGYASCIRIWPPWWGVRSDPPEVVAEATVDIGPDGTVKIPIETSLAKELHGDQDHKYNITAEVTDSSRRMISGSGSVVAPRQPYQVYVWTHRGFYDAGAEARVSVQARTPDGSPVNGKAVLKVLAVTYEPGGAPVEIEKSRFELVARDGNPAVQVLQFPQTGHYRLAVEFDDGAGHKVEGTAHTTVRGKDFDGKDFRFPDLEVVAEKAEYAPGEDAAFVVNIAQEGGSILVFERPQNGGYPKPRVVTLAQGKSTRITLPVGTNDQPNFFLEVVTVHGAKIHTQVVQVPVPPSKRIADVNLTPSQETYKPQADGTVQIQVKHPDGTPVQGPVILTGYDKALEYISGGSNVPNVRDFFWGWKRSHFMTGVSSLNTVNSRISLPGLNWEPVGVFGNRYLGMSTRMNFAVGGSGGGFGAGVGFKNEIKRNGRADYDMVSTGAAPMAAAAPAPMEAAKSKAITADSIDGLLASNQSVAGAEEATPMIRQDFADLLVWHAAATTDSQGKVSLPVHFPDDLTTWKLRAWVLGPNTEVGEASVEVISRKDLLVRMQAPRFFVERDEVVLSGIVHNDLKDKQNVRAVLELDGKTLAPLEGQATEQRFEIAPGGEHRFDWRVKVIAEGEATVRMKALAAGESDAVEKKFPVYVHGMLRQDAWSLAIRPDQGQGTIAFEVPDKRRPAQTRFEVRYSPSLAAAMVDALPFLVSYPHGCTEQTLNRFVPTVITQKVLLDLGLDLKAIRDKGVNLNAQELGDPVKRAQQWRRYRKNDQDPVFDEKVVKKMAAAGIDRLESMQANDGGWGWWPGAAQGSVHLTAQVVDGLLQAQAAGADVPAGMLSRGLDWLARHEEEELRRLNLPEKAEDHKTQADNEDALVHAALVAGDLGNKGMRTHLYNDRLTLSKSMQALVGLACATVKETERRDMIIRNLEQFQKQDEENQTAWLDFGNDHRWWYWYDDETETLAAYLKLRLIKDGKDPVASRLVKYLLNNRKHGNYWKSTRDTAAAISALAMYIKASGETTPDLLVELWLDGKKVKEAPINKDNLFSFDHAFVIEGEALTAGKHQLEIRRKGAGPLYANAYLACFTLEDHLRAAGLEVKVQRNLYKLVPEKTQDLVSGAHGQALKQQGSRYRREPLGPEATVKSGDLLEVELITESKNDYEYLMLEDFKPAGCEAVDLQSGYVWSQGLNTYREFRDEKVTHYLERLPRGKQSLTYRLRAEIPGKFSALPSVIEGMYAPELKGNAEERSVVVEDTKD